MKFKILVIMIAFIIVTPLLFSSEILATTEETTEPTPDYLLFQKTVLIAGSSYIIDIFDTPPDCSKLYVYANVGFYFTGCSEVYIRSVEHNTTENHSIWGTGLYFSGRLVLPSIQYFNGNKFVPGKQIIEIAGVGFGFITYYVKGETS
jgi:hypothetical protein